MLVVPLVVNLRYDFAIDRVTHWPIFAALCVAAAGQIVAGYAMGVYRRRFRYGTFEEVIAVVSSVLVAGAVLQVWGIVVGAGGLPRSVPVLATVFAASGTISIRSLRRLFVQRQLRPNDGEPIVVVGAGDAGEQVIRQLVSSRTSPYLPVALVDDDPLKEQLRIQGVNVQGCIDDLPAVAKASGAKAILLAIPGAEQWVKNKVASIAQNLGMPLLVLPPASEIFGAVNSSDIRPVRPEDLLGRDQVGIDEDAVRNYVTGKRVLVTGAGGSIGSELCRQLALLQPSQLVMLDRDESGLHATQLTIDGHGLLNSSNIVLADIRDVERMDEVFDAMKPEVVFHAAALKHMPLLEMHPTEAWKTNVVGTHNVLMAARRAGVGHFVNISTDKAADPQNVLGGTKRITERLTAGFAEGLEQPWVSVRFGNVLGSRGSVLTSFHAQVEQGGPLTVTHPHVTRYFMTVQEAVRLTIYAGAIGRPGEVLVLDMGEPVKILEVAERFAHLVTPPLEIVFTGLRPGEKMHEVLLGPHEVDVRPVHPMVSHVPVPPLSFDVLPDEGVEELLDLA